MIRNKKMKSVSRKREKQTRYLSQAIQLEEAVNPHIIRATMTMVSLAILVFLVWAGLTNINEVARTPGEVVPQGYQQTVQHLEGGMVAAINVHEGDVVEEGQVLVTLNDAGIRDDLARASSKQLTLEMQAERLRAFVEGRTPDFSRFDGATPKMIADQKAFFSDMRAARAKEEQIIREQIAQKEQSLTAQKSDLATAKKNLAIAQDMYKRRAALNKKGYTSDMQLLEEQQRVNDLEGDIERLENGILVAHKEITEFEGRVASLSARHRDEANEKLDLVLAEKSQNANVIDKVQERIARLQIRAPSRGLVKGLNVNTIGEVVQPGQTLMEIVPLDKDLEVQGFDKLEDRRLACAAAARHNDHIAGPRLERKIAKNIVAVFAIAEGNIVKRHRALEPWQAGKALCLFGFRFNIHQGVHLHNAVAELFKARDHRAQRIKRRQNAPDENHRRHQSARTHRPGPDHVHAKSHRCHRSQNRQGMRARFRHHPEKPQMEMRHHLPA